MVWRSAPPADEQEQLCVRGLEQSPVFELVRTSDLYASVTYQPLLQGSASGVVRLVRAGGDTETVPRNAICLCEEIPNELPPVRALVTHALQMPLAHTALLCANRRTPNLGLPGSDFQDLARFEGQRVRLTVGASAYSIEPLEGTDDDEEPPRHAKIEIPPPSKGPLELIPLKLSTPPDVQAACGAKASGYVRLLRSVHRKTILVGGKVVDVPWPMKTLDSVVVPFAFAEAHLAACGKREAGAILREPVNESLVRELARVWKMRWAASPKIILRSSTNCEDLDGFNGAGLYTSVVVSEQSELGEGLAKVWASVWSPRAVAERREYSMDEASVRAAVLVQPFVGKAECNGVLLTDYSPNHKKGSFVGVFLNAMAGAASRVTDAAEASAEGGSEQTLVWMVRAGLTDACPLARTCPEAVLDPDAVRAVASAGYAVHQLAQEDGAQGKLAPVAGTRSKAGAPAGKRGMPRQANEGHLCWDIEWMVVSDEPDKDKDKDKLRRVLLLQARPFDAPDDAPAAQATQGSSSCIRQWLQYDRAGINATDAKKRFESDKATVAAAMLPSPPPCYPSGQAADSQHGRPARAGALKSGVRSGEGRPGSGALSDRSLASRVASTRLAHGGAGASAGASRGGGDGGKGKGGGSGGKGKGGSAKGRAGCGKGGSGGRG